MGNKLGCLCKSEKNHEKKMVIRDIDPKIPADLKRISVKDGYRIINIQNLERKPVREYHQEVRSQLQKTRELTKNYNLMSDDIYLYKDTSTNKNSTVETNNFIGSFLNAYNSHGDVVLNPDTIWIAISLYFSTYINNHAEALRDKLVYHEGKKNLVVEEFVGSKEESIQKEKEWDYFFGSIYEQIKIYAKPGVIESLECDFSTTGNIEKLISTSLIMNSLKKYFSYTRMICFCGINNIYFEGTREDWIKIIAKTKNLSKYDVDTKLNHYIEKILIILRHFVNTWDGKVDVKFWNNIMNTEEKRIGSGSQVQTFLEGWILYFFGEYGRMDLDEVPDYSYNVPVILINQVTKTKKNLDIVGNWCSVSKINNHTYKTDLGVGIVDNSRKQEDW
jgi:hypothetical protein